MTAAPTLAPKQIGLFDAPAPPKTKVCAECGKARALKLFAWKDKAKTAREDVCNTCRFPRDFSGPSAKPAAPPPSVRAKAIATPHPAGFIPVPPALWSKKGDVVRVLINDERTGLTLCVVGVVTGVKPTNKLVSGYQKLRNFLVRQGWQIAQIRGGVAAPLLEKTAREGRTDGG